MLKKWLWQLAERHRVVQEKIKNRVPHIIFLYWVIKIASTTLGETGADMFSMTFNLGYAKTILIFFILFLAFFSIKLILKKYNSIIYWITFTFSAIAGTAISDFIDRTLHFGYLLGSVFLVGILFIVLWLWYEKEKSINVEYISTTSAEIFYWTAFLFANTLGTAAGDFLSDNLGLGFIHSAILISSILIFVVLLHFFTKVSGVLLFWIAFVLTRPFGATFGDFLTKPFDKGGINIGTVLSSIFFALILIFAIMKENKIERSLK